MPVASHNTARTAGSPIMTDSEITVPALATALIEAILNGGPLATKKTATNANCPANIAANSSNPHRLVPQNFQIRGGRAAPGCGAGGPGAAGLSNERINRLSNGDQGSARSSRLLISLLARSTAPYMLAWFSASRDAANNSALCGEMLLRAAAAANIASFCTADRATRPPSALRKALPINTAVSAAPGRPFVSSIRLCST